MTAEIRLHPELTPFVVLMEGRLREKDPLVESGAWSHWQECSLGFLADRLHDKEREVREALRRPIDLEKLRKATADLANFAMMIEARAQMNAAEEQTRG